MKRFFCILPLLLASLVTFSCINDDDASATYENLLDAGDGLPAFSLTKTDGEEVTTEQLTSRPCVLVFFNTSCGDCRRELPIVDKAYRTYGERVNFLCVAREQGEASVKSYWQEADFAVPVAPQEDRAVYNLFAERGIPRVYVCEKGGRIAEVFTERVGTKKLTRAIEKVLSE